MEKKIEQLTVKKLHKLCQKEIKKGNGSKLVVVASDVEGNEFTGIWGGFAPLSPYIYSALKDTMYNATIEEAQENLIALGVY